MCQGSQNSHPKSIGRLLQPTSRGWIANPVDPRNLVPIGAVGELLIEGPVLAQGYLGDDAKTSAAFVKASNRLLKRDVRLYRTGDLVKYALNGDIVYVSRSDAQLKINGQRLELGEVETQILRCLPNTVVAVELLRLPGQAASSIIAFTQFSAHTESPKLIFDGKFPEIATLRQELKQLLPTYMLPKMVLPVTRIPTTVSGKTDRKFLRSLVSDLSAYELGKLQEIQHDLDRPSLRQPQSPAARVLVQLWARVLGINVELIGLDDHFFALGGDSMAALRLCSEAKAKNLRLPVSVILQHPILMEMSTRVSQTREEPESLDIEPFSLLPGGTDAQTARSLASIACDIPSQDIEDMYPCTPLQEGMLALSSGLRGDYLACFVLKLSSTVDLDCFKAAWQSTTDLVPILRTRIAHITGLGFLQVVQARRNIEWTECPRIDEYLQQKKLNPPGLGSELVSFAIAHNNTLEPKHSATEFSWTIHHALFDAWSLSLILDLVAKHLRSETIPRSPAPFKYFIADRARNYDSLGWREYWREYFSGLSTCHFPPSAPRRRNFSQDKLASLNKIERTLNFTTAATSSITAASIIRAAWALVIGRHVNCRDVVFGETMHGRNTAISHTQHIIGPTITTIPVRIRLDDDLPIAVFLAAVQASNASSTVYEQLSLQDIARISTEAEQACNFQSLLMIQPKEQDVMGSQLDSFGEWDFRGSAAIGTYPLLVQCELQHASVAVTVTYDSQVVSGPEISCLVDRFAHVLPQLSSGSSTRVGDIEEGTIAELTQILTRSRTGPQIPGLSGNGTERSRCTVGNLTPQLHQIANVGNQGGFHAWVTECGRNDKICPLFSIGELVLQHSVVTDEDYPILEGKFSASTHQWLLHGVSEEGCRQDAIVSTGLLACYEHDGSIAVIGNKSRQIHSRGWRVQLDFIEHCLKDELGAMLDVDRSATMTDFDVAVNVACPRDSDDDLIIAFVGVGLAGSEHRTTVQKVGSVIMDRVKKSLPPHMVPSGILYMEALPLTDGGSPAYQRLQEIASTLSTTQLAMGGMDLNEASRPPETTMEIKVQELMTKVLIGNEKQIEANSSFFALGGDSITAMQLAALCRNIGLNITVPDIFRERTCARLAKVAKDRSLVNVIQDVAPNGEAVDLTSAQQLYLSSSKRFDTVTCDHVYIELAASTTLETLHGTLDRILASHSELRSRFQTDSSGAWYRTISRDVRGSYHLRNCKVDQGPAACLHATQSSSAISFAEIDAISTSKRLLHPSRGPLLAAVAFDMPSLVQRLSLTIHPLVESSLLWNRILEGLQTSVGRFRTLRPNRPTHNSFAEVLSRYGDFEQFCQSTLPILGLALPDIEDIYPCSPVQKGILISQSSDPTTYILRYDFEVVSTDPKTTVNITDLATAWRAVVQKHSILRTLFVTDMPGLAIAQIVLKRVDPIVRCVPPGESRDTYIDAAVSRIEDLPPNQPKHAVIFEQDDSGRIWLTLYISHALVDAHSVDLIFRDLGLTYSKVCIPPPTTAYKDYVVYVESQPTTRTSQEFWSTHLAGIEPCLFPTDPTCSTGGIQMISVPSLDSTQLRAFCCTNDMVPSSVFLTAWAIVLQAYTRSVRPCFGYIASGRELLMSGIDEVVGPTIATLPVVVSLGSEMHIPVLEVLQQTQAEVAGASTHQLLSLADIHHSLQLNNTRLFNTAMSIRSDTHHPTDRPRSKLDFRWCGGSDTAGFDIAVHIHISTDEARIVLAYRSQVSGYIRGVSSAFNAVLSSIITRPHALVRELELISSDELQQIYEWNANRPKATPSTLHDLLAGTISRQPLRPAVCGWDGDLTYAELDMYSTRLAREVSENLAALETDFDQEIFVPVCFEKSVYAVVAMLAVMKAGCAFVPVDSKDMHARLRPILIQTRAKIVLASRYCAELISPDYSVSTFIVSKEDMCKPGIPMDDSTRRNAPASSVAYCIFTSGSTGQPKGVLIEHCAVGTSCVAHGTAMGFTRDSRVLHFSSFSFDGCIMELFTTLIYGGLICVPTEAERSDYDDLSRFIVRYQVNWAFLTPSLARHLPIDVLQNLDVLVVGGEVLTEADRRIWSALRRFIVAYGPTECTIICFTADYSAEEQSKASIGRAIAPGWRAWIADADTAGSRLLPIGATGELLLEGPPLARGYLNDPTQTAATFLSSPPWLPGCRLYRTGDLVRYNPNGTVSFIGRKDLQLKINGQRVEVGEIEEQLRQSCNDAACVAVEPIQLLGNPTRTLVAFVQIGDCPIGNDTTTDLCKEHMSTMTALSSTLNAQLEEKLPSYMIPQVYVPITKMPLSTSGKTDRRALQQMCANLSAEQIASLRRHKLYRLPSSATERLLADIWAELLDVDINQVGVDDNFFQSGGDSILAMRLVSLSRSRGLSFSIRNVFSDPTISALSEISDRKTYDLAQGRQQVNLAGSSTAQEDTSQHSCCADVLVGLAQQLEIDPADLEDALPATYTQCEMLGDAISGSAPAFNYISLRLSQLVDSDQLTMACWKVTSHFEALRTVFANVEGHQLLQIILSRIPDDCVSSHRVPPGYNAPDYDEVLCNEDSQKPFDSKAPLTKFIIIKDSRNAPCSLIIRLSHAQYDGISLNMLFQALDAAYAGKLLPSSVPFSRYTRYILSKRTDSQKYWQQVLAGSSMTFLRPELCPASVNHAVQVTTTMDIPVIPQITPATLFSTAWALVLSKFCGSSDVVYGGVVAGRSGRMDDIMDVFGPCVNKIPIRVRIGSYDTVRSLLLAVQEQYASAEFADSFSLPDIIENCTNWSNGTYFGSVAQYQNASLDPSNATTKNFRHSQLADALRWVDTGAKPGRGVFVLCSPSGQGSQHSVDLESYGSGVDTELGAMLLREIVEKVEYLSSEVLGLLRSE
ncbi:Malformin synthetase mlfA [Pseudocercospora fuligena]|uniref:Malformin synthetase mlfA n=1 Tax=Pseudocercospora fuligena TaxID=685502 RepID=A0A8H6RX29_9PEZI|nr:Malformin synthetase mlfA [Pseudocercospora fuligena]